MPDPSFPPGGRAGGPGIATVARWEGRKLLAQKRTYIGAAVAVFLPLAFAASVAFSSASRKGDIPFRDQDHLTGLAVPLVVLTFASLFLFPLVAALVAGDIMAAEDHNGTMKTILALSLRREQILAGKIVSTGVYVALAAFLMGVTAISAGVLASGYRPLRSLGGLRLDPNRALVLIIASFALYLVTVLALASFGILCSVLTRNSAAAIVATIMLPLLMRIVPLLPHTSSITPYLLSEQFSAWQGFFQRSIDWGAISRAVWVSVAYGAPALVLARFVFLRRDIAG